MTALSGRRLPRSATAVVTALAIGFGVTACSPRPTSVGPSHAKSVWDSVNAEIEASQAVVGTGWLSSDTAARECGVDGAQWVLTRFGPGTHPGERNAQFDELSARWEAMGWRPVRSDFGGVNPGVQLRYPAASSLDDGFFIEYRSTQHGSTLQLQTPCTQGDVDALNREKYGERHTNTPPDIPGTASPSASAEPTTGATP
ncbi:hypothetical protein EDF64_11331 [Curtobacterium flaccumfaciens]|uniref:LppA-like lipoprotein n=2 Tax=Curtobacterium flaccumfaciens TaxID=2035 RepID=A0A4R6DDL6_9MICO|nr:hypothetical protein EDF64_11331 [Curtobacterium flaccumfaciens]